MSYYPYMPDLQAVDALLAHWEANDEDDNYSKGQAAEDLRAAFAGEVADCHACHYTAAACRENRRDNEENCCPKCDHAPTDDSGGDL